jgi:putative endonuclease
MFFPAKAGIQLAAGTMFYVYLLASKPYGTLYVGLTTQLAGRVWEHKIKAVPGFTARYGVDGLVWFESHDSAEAAMRRAKRDKEWKLNLIERDNPWIDLYPNLVLNRAEFGNGHRPSPVWVHP